jgi:NAD(P)-dependent dehydrogenase (short-subunit alcohol dehydrogenase family)
MPETASLDHDEIERTSWPGLAGRVALVTGGSRNMGRAFALGLADAGADVAILDLPGQESAARSVLSQIEQRGRRGVFVPLDIRDAGSIAGAVAEVDAALGIRVLINNAGKTDDEVPSVLDYPAPVLGRASVRAGRPIVNRVAMSR